MLKNTFLAILLLFSYILIANSEPMISAINANNSYGFFENKGQIIDQYGNKRSDVLYLYDNNNFKCQLKYDGFSYEAYRIEVNETKTKLYNKKYVPDFARVNKTVTYYSHRIDIRLEGANPFPQINSFDKSEDYVNYYNAHTGENGVTDVYNYKKIVYKDIYPNIDFVFYVKNNEDILNENGKNYIKYDIVVRPGGDVKNIKMIYEGANSLILNPNGGLSIYTSQGKIIEQKPKSYIITGNYNDNSTGGIELASEFILQDNILSFIIPDYDKSKTLVIDPEIVWGTYVGGNDYDVVNKISHDELGNILAVGETVSESNIATSGAYQTTYGGGSFDAFLIKVSKQGQRLWATYYGGNGRDVGYGVNADVVWHSVYLMGTTNSRNGISTEGAHQEDYGLGYSDAFLAKFDLMGHREWGTYYGGADAHGLIGGEYLYDAAIDTRFGDIYITGVVSSRDSIATQYAHQEQLGGDFDAVLAKFTSDGELDWATYYGGTEFDGAYGITLDPSGYITIGGYTASNNTNGDDEEVIATDGAYQTSKSGNSDAFIARFNLRGTRQWGTYFGGPDVEIVNAATADAHKNIYIAGHTSSSSGIASSGAHQTSFSGSKDGFIAKFSSSGERLWSTYYGGERIDDINTITSNSNGEIAIGGYTTSKTHIASPNSFIDHYIGDEYEIEDGDGGTLTVVLEDGFIALFDTLGTRQWGTYFGDDSLDIVNDIDYDLNYNLVVCGKTQSIQNLTTPETFQPNYTDAIDGFIIKFGEFMRIVNISTPFCVGNPITISYETGTDLNSGNVFTAQLSDSTGNFSNPVDIGTKTAVDDGDIIATIPSNTPPGTHYRIRIVSSNPAKTSKDNGYDITINPLPTPSITGETPVCSRASYTYSVEADENISNLWSVENGEIIGDSTLEEVVVRWKDEDNGIVKVIQTNKNTYCVDSTSNDIEINITPIPNIIGETEVIAYSEELYRTPSTSKLSFLWRVTGGILQGDSTNNQILVDWGSVGTGTVQLFVTNTTTNCIDSLTLTIAINSSPVKINGKKNVCANSQEDYFVENDETMTYKWEAVGGEIQGNSTDTLVSILWGPPGNGIINLIRTNTGTQQVDTIITNIQILELPIVGIFGLDELCEGSNEYYYAVNKDSVENLWTVYNGTILGNNTADSVLIQWNNIEQGNDSTLVKASITLTQTSLKTGCTNSKTKIINMSSNPSAKFTGDTSVCEKEVKNYYSVDFQPGMINDWIVKGGTIIGSSSDSTLQVEWGSVGSGSIKLIQTSTTLCTDSNTINITINALPQKPTIKQAGKALVSSAETGNQWFANNEIIQGATEKVFSPDSSGYYSVQVTNENGCISEMSKPFYFDINSVKDLMSSAKLLSLYPNPTDGLIHFELKIEGISPATIQLRNIIGNIVYEFKAFNLNNNIDKTIDLSNLPSGIYILQVRINDNIYNYKIIKL